MTLKIWNKYSLTTKNRSKIWTEITLSPKNFPTNATKLGSNGFHPNYIVFSSINILLLNIFFGYSCSHGKISFLCLTFRDKLQFCPTKLLRRHNFWGNLYLNPKYYLTKFPQRHKFWGTLFFNPIKFFVRQTFWDKSHFCPKKFPPRHNFWGKS